MTNFNPDSGINSTKETEGETINLGNLAPVGTQEVEKPSKPIIQKPSESSSSVESPVVSPGPPPAEPLPAQTQTEISVPNEAPPAPAEQIIQPEISPVEPQNPQEISDKSLDTNQEVMPPVSTLPEVPKEPQASITPSTSPAESSPVSLEDKLAQINKQPVVDTNSASEIFNQVENLKSKE